MSSPEGTFHLEYPEVKEDLTLIVRTALGCVFDRVPPDLWAETEAARTARLDAYRAVRRFFLALGDGPDAQREAWREMAGELAYDLGRFAQFIGLEFEADVAEGRAAPLEDEPPTAAGPA